MKKSYFLKIYVGLILFFLYLPIFLLVLYSFTNSENFFIWNGFSLALFKQMLNKDFFIILSNTFFIALVSSIYAIFLGTLGAVGTFYSKNKTKKIINFLTKIPIINAEIVIALSLTLLFVFLEKYLFHFSFFSIFTLLIGHICLTLPYVYFLIEPKLKQMDKNLYDAATDLGCTPINFFLKIIIPQIKYEILYGFLLSLILSLDDYIITAFLSGPGLFSGCQTIKTFSTFIQEKIKKGPIPLEMRAFTTLFILIILLILLIRKLYKFLIAKKQKK